MDDLTEFLQGISEDAPCGVFIESDESLEKRFVHLDQAMHPPLESIFEDDEGEGSAPDVVIDWADIVKQCSTLLCETRDLRIMVVLIRAAMHVDGLAGVCAAIEVLNFHIEEHWDSVFPESLSEDDDQWRVSCLNELNDRQVLKELETLPIFVMPDGAPFTLSQLLNAAGDSQRRAACLQASVNSVDVDTWREQLQIVLARLKNIESAVNRLQSAGYLDISPWSEPFEQLQGLLIDGGVPAAGRESASGASLFTGTVRSREEALQALDSVARYFYSHEPSSPVPLIVERARKLATMSFLDILNDVSPESRATLDLMEQGHDDED
ncbi:Uncharacterised protein [BD1-7 clade bacterium]|uniref:ImpA N-terminal domain-containing protein n=1 Tax=BD1-7 clade bacterium TaxID=2029982 RepID=A0A5S9QXL2_9GAMM|nr:Uncharacterised protein [BD1-7 clade bacterium]